MAEAAMVAAAMAEVLSVDYILRRMAIMDIIDITRDPEVAAVDRVLRPVRAIATRRFFRTWDTIAGSWRIGHGLWFFFGT